MKYKHTSMTNYYLIKQTRLLGTVEVSKKIRCVFVPEEKRDGGDIKYRIRNRLKVSSIWINHKIGMDILKYYYYLDNETWLCDKSSIYSNQILVRISLCIATTSLIRNISTKRRRNLGKSE